MRSKIKNMRTTDKEILLEAQSEKVEMTLNTESSVATGLLTQRLTELYENPIEASVRETVSNAIDAVVAVGGGRVEIQTPSRFSPILTIKDNGIGMSYDDLKSVYAKYGASTKTDDLSQIGAYGLGAKAPLAYCNEFTVTSIKDGEKVVIIVAREEITNYIKIVSREETDLEPGTIVSIPVEINDINEFQNAVDMYKKSPNDQNVELYIDGEEYGNDKFVQIDDIPLMEKDGKVVLTGRAWISKEKIDKFIEPINIEYFNAYYVIGSWAYQSPNRSPYIESDVFIELKTGIVGFNSSRDTILNNDRFHELNNLVMEHLASESFRKKVLKAICELPVEDYKEVLMSIVSSKGDLIDYDLHEIRRYKTYFHEGYEINLNELTHKSGLSLVKFIESLKGHEAFVVNGAKMYHGATSLENHLLSPYKNNDGDYIKKYNWRKATLDKINGRMTKFSQNIELSAAIMSLFGLNGKTTLHSLLITDIEKSNVSRIRNGRRALIDYAIGDSNSTDYAVTMAATESSKSEIEEGLKIAKELGFEMKVLTADEARSIITTFNKRRTKRKPQNRSVKLQTVLTDSEGRRITLSDIDANEKNVILLAYSSLRMHNIKYHKRWYEDMTGLSSDEYNLYISYGDHRNVDVELLEDLGEVYVSQHYGAVGTSAKIKQLTKERPALQKAIKDDDELRKIKGMLLRVLNVYNVYFIGSNVEVQQNAVNYANEAYELNIDLSLYNQLADKLSQAIEELADDAGTTSDMLYRLYYSQPEYYNDILDENEIKLSDELYNVYMSGAIPSDLTKVHIDLSTMINDPTTFDETDITHQAQRSIIKIYIEWLASLANIIAIEID